MVMNENLDRLPRDCSEITADVDLEVRAGAEYAGSFPGEMFSYDQRVLEAPACARVNAPPCP